MAAHPLDAPFADTVAREGLEAATRRFASVAGVEGLVARWRAADAAAAHPDHGDRRRMRRRLLAAGRPAAEVDALTRRAARLLSHLPDPAAPRSAGRLLVAGGVRRGDLVALTAAASDAGYGFVLVVTEREARPRAQDALDTHLVAPGRGENPFAGWLPLTDPGHDFAAPTCSAASVLRPEVRGATQRVLAVVSATPGRLRDLTTWLADAPATPTLVLDTRFDRPVGPVTPALIDLLAALPRHAYVGFSRTPLAQIYLDDAAADLAPRDGVVDLTKG